MGSRPKGWSRATGSWSGPNVKVGASEGAVDVTQVIAAIDWVTQHAHDPGLNIRVISLSHGTDSTQAYTVDPLAQAAEQPWRHGMVVVASAGNDGRKSKHLADPAADPYLIAAGADDPMGTMDTADDVVPAFARHGNTHRPVDVTAPATHIIGLRVPGSTVDTLTTNTGQVGTRFQRGSGTSEAAAIVAGVAVLVRHGIVNAAAALNAQPAVTVQTWAASTGTATLDGARGDTTVTSAGVPLTGQVDVFGQPCTSATMAAAQTTATAWTGGTWNSRSWAGDDWV